MARRWEQVYRPRLEAWQGSGAAEGSGEAAGLPWWGARVRGRGRARRALEARARVVGLLEAVQRRVAGRPAASLRTLWAALRDDGWSV